MSGQGKHAADDALALAIAQGAAPEAAAKAVNVSARTVFRRLKEPAFCARVAEIRAEIVSQVTGMLASVGPEAVSTLRTLLQEEDGKVRHAASKTLLDHFFRSQEYGGLVETLRALRRELDEVKCRVGSNSQTGGEATPGGTGSDEAVSCGQSPRGSPAPRR